MKREEQAHFWSGRKVAITGGTGFIGHHLAGQLVRAGAQVTALVRPTSARQRLMAAGIRCVEGNLNDPVAAARAFQGCEFVFHLAGLVDFEDDWERFERINIDGTRQVIAAAGAAGVRRLVHTSSISAVGAANRPIILDETARWNLARLRIPYVTSKRRAEELALAASGRELEVVAVNPGCVVGPEDFSASEFGTMCRRFWRGRLPFHFGGGNNYVDVRDVARGHLLAAEHGRAGQRYILGGHNRSYSAFFTDLARVAPRPIFRVRVPDMVGTIVAAIQARCRRPNARAYLTPAQVRMLSLFFYYRSDKAVHELGYQPRPFHESLLDTHAFWMGRKSA